jgi:hypothetical protein
MKKITKYSLIIFVLLTFAACKKFLNPDEFSIVSGKNVYTNLGLITNALTSAYANLPGGYNDIGESWLSGAADELEAVSSTQSIQDFNQGNWSAYNNPDNQFSRNYTGIRKVADFLQGTDTLTWKSYQFSDPVEYNRRTNLIIQYRAEARFLRAFFYAELIKRFGGVPLVKSKLSIDPNSNDLTNLKRNSFEECVNYITSECDSAAAVLPLRIATSDLASQDGRATRGAALALKSRVLLYAASDLFNQPGNSNPLIGYTSGDQHARWILAAKASKDVMNLNVYTLNASYRNLFLLGASSSSEVIFGRRISSSNYIDRLHYPIGYDQGSTGNCPVGNLVDDYEMLDGSAFNWNNPTQAANPYFGRDPRLKASILTNNELWNKRNVDISTNGLDGLPKTRATKTGYYLKKFITDNLNFTNGDRVPHQWIFFRYAEVLLNYAEAMNEAYQSPTYKNSDLNVSAQEAINLVRRRADVLMPYNSSSTYSNLKLKLEHERRIELAFEGHRWWDLRRWMKGSLLGSTITGVTITANTSNNTFIYQPIDVEQRVFDATKMYLYPIPQSEINKTGGTIAQNPNWN